MGVLYADISTTVALPASATPGSTVTGTTTYTNLGSATASFTATVVVNGVTTTQTVTSLPPGSSTVATVTVIVGTTGATVTANVGTSSVPESNTANNANTATMVSVVADLVTSIDLPSNAVAGSTIAFTVTVGNNTATASTTATNVVGTVVLSNGQTITFSTADLGTGTSAIVTLTTTVPANGSTTLSATVTVRTSTPETNTANNVGTDTMGVLYADVSTIITMPTSGTIGYTLTGTVTFANNGTSAAQNVTASISIGANSTLTGVTSATFIPNGKTATFGVNSLAGSNSVSFTFTFVMPSFGVVTGTSTITTTSADSNKTNNMSVAKSTAILGTANVSISITAPAFGSIGQTITATVTVANLGSLNANNITTTVTLPNGSSTVVFVAVVLPVGSTTVIAVPYKIRAFDSGTLTWVAKIATTSPESTTVDNIATAVTQVNLVRTAKISGKAWLDNNRNREFETGDIVLKGWTVEVLKNGTVAGTASTDINGDYVVSNLVPGTGYSVRFRDPTNKLVATTPFNQSVNANSNGTNAPVVENPSTGTTNTKTGQIIDITLYDENTIVKQNLPLDPSGIVYDSVTRKPVAGATVKLIFEGTGFDPSTMLVGGSDNLITGDDGSYKFFFVGAPSGVYRIEVKSPAGYANGAAVQGGVAQPGGLFNVPNCSVLIQANRVVNGGLPPVSVTGATPVTGCLGGDGTQYFQRFAFDFSGDNRPEIFNNHIPLDPLVSGAILVSKVGDKSVAEVADSVRYTIRMVNTTAGPIAGVTLEDLLPAGFRYIPGTARLNGANLADPAGGIGRALTFNIASAGVLPGNTTWELNYFVRLGVGSQQGDGINRATAVFPGAGGTPVRSNTALFKVNVQGGVFSNDGCIVGKVYADCDGTHTQGNVSGSRELGIPGVRLVLLDGSFVVTDNEGKYSICGVKPQTHVVRIDRTTLPKGSRMLPSSNRNAGVGDSLFVDLKGGELARADFIEGSCSPEVLDQVKARRAQGGVLAPETEKGKELKIESRSESSAQQILPSPREVQPASAGGTRP